MPTNLFRVLGHKRTRICSQVAHNNYQLGVPAYANFKKIVSSVNNYFIGGSLCVLHLTYNLYVLTLTRILSNM